jgi:malate dehydrogenase (oxaloacetate-decarboxylating)(NADP+)
LPAAQDTFGKTVLIQFEDFSNLNAFRLLHHFQHSATTFNDDIQGTAAVALAGILVSTRLTGKKLSDYTFLFAGAGEAGTGIAELIAYAISKESSIPIPEARKQIYLVDSSGLVTEDRKESLQHHKLPFAHDVDFESDLLSAIQRIKPSVLIGVSAVPNMFNETVCNTMALLHERPIIFALSNPTSKAECTASEAYQWTQGKCIFASGSPFDPVTLPNGQRFIPGQGNNAYVFPGIGLGALAAGSTKIDDDDMLTAAETLASLVTQEDLNVGSIYPPLAILREVSAHIAAAIVYNAHEKGVATKPKPENILSYVKSIMYNPLA